MEPLLTAQQLAERLNVPATWVSEQTRSRAKARSKSTLPCIRLGKYVRFRWSEVSAWLAERSR